MVGCVQNLHVVLEHGNPAPFQDDGCEDPRAKSEGRETRDGEGQSDAGVTGLACCGRLQLDRPDFTLLGLLPT